LKQRKSHLIYFLIIIALTAKLFLLTEKNNGVSYQYILNNKISSFLPQEENNKLNSDFLPELSIKFQPQWNIHIESLNKLVRNGEFKKYNKLNKYFKAHVSISGEKYKVKIKVHGKSPDGHVYEKNTSLKIKFKNNKNPFKSKFVKLIIAHRINTSFDNMKILGDFFSLLKTEGYWYNITINSNNAYPYLVQIPIKEDFFLNYVDGNDIIDFAPDSYNLTSIDSSIQINYKKDSSKVRNNLISELRNEFVSENSDNIYKYFDEDYISRFVACNLVGGFLGHGYNEENIHILYNKKQNKFYPMLTRDNFISPLEKGRNEFDQLTVWEHFSMGEYKRIKNDLITYLNNNLDLRSKALIIIQDKSISKLKELVNTLSKFERMTQSSSTIRNLFKNPRDNEFETRLSWKQHRSSMIINNFEHIKKRIEQSAYSLYQFQTIDSIEMQIKSHSIFPQIIQKFNIEVKPKSLNSIQLKVDIEDKYLIDTTLKIIDSKIDFTKLINHIKILDNTRENGDRLFYTIKLIFNTTEKSHGTPYLKESINLKLSSLLLDNKETPIYILQK
jgi:hypothetical protein